MARRRLGELLLEQGAVTREQLESALAYQRQTGNRLGAALVEQGVLSETKLVTALAAALGMDVVVPSEVEIDWGALHALRDRFCEANDLFPVSLDDNKGRKQLTVAMSDPLNLPAIEEIEFTTGFKVVPKVATLTEVRTAIRHHYHRQGGDGGAARPPSSGMRADAPMAGLTISPTVSGGWAKVGAQVSNQSFPGMTHSQSQVTAAARPGSKGGTSAARPSSKGTAAARPNSKGGSAVRPNSKGSHAVNPRLPGETVAEKAARDELTELIRAKEEEAQHARNNPSVHSDLAYLVGDALTGHEPHEQLERVERQLFALLRLMAKKGMITREEFQAEFDD